MSSPLVVPGELSRPLLVKHSTEVQRCLSLGFQGASESVVIQPELWLTLMQSMAPGCPSRYAGAGVSAESVSVEASTSATCTMYLQHRQKRDNSQTVSKRLRVVAAVGWTIWCNQVSVEASTPATCTMYCSIRKQALAAEHTMDSKQAPKKGRLHVVCWAGRGLMVQKVIFCCSRHVGCC
jgi:hypothetical protein